MGPLMDDWPFYLVMGGVVLAVIAFAVMLWLGCP